MAFHAGAELRGNLECFQVNPLLKDYNGPACAYVSGPYGGYTVNARGNRFMLSDYWSGQMMLEFYRELTGPNGGGAFFENEPPCSGNRDGDRANSPHHRAPEPWPFSRRPWNPTMAIKPWERWPSRKSDSAVATAPRVCGVNHRAETTVPGLYAAGDMASVPHGYMLGAFTYGKICRPARDRLPCNLRVDRGSVDDGQGWNGNGARESACAALAHQPGLPPHQVEYKIRRQVNDYLQPPKTGIPDGTGTGLFRTRPRGTRSTWRTRPARADAGRRWNVISFATAPKWPLGLRFFARKAAGDFITTGSITRRSTT